MGTVAITQFSNGSIADANQVNADLNAIANVINGNLDDTNFVSGGNLNAAKLGANTITPDKISTELQKGWENYYGSTLFPAPNTITYNGNRNYSVVFNSTDLTGAISNGMRLKLTRTVTAPTQCTSLNGTTQFYSKTSPAGMTFTNFPVASAWVKMTSYTNQVVESRYNGTSGWQFRIDGSGLVTLQGFNAGAANFNAVQSYQSIPLNKWVHISAQLDMSTSTLDATHSWVMIDGVNVPAQKLTGGTAPTALIQAGNLEIGSTNAGTLPFNGKLAQVAIFSAAVTQATMQGYISQGLAGTETSLISGYSFNGVVTDLNANANNLTPNGSAVATTVDSPFAGGANAATGYTAGTTEYAEVFNAAFSTNTTLTLQVPDGYAIPTSGGVSAASYSTTAKPYGWPGLDSILAYAILCTNATSTTVAGSGTDMLGLNLTYTAPLGRKVKISGFLGAASSSAANSAVIMEIFDVTANTLVASSVGSTNASGDLATCAPVAYNFAGGTRNYKARLCRGNNAATANSGGAVTNPNLFTVELLPEV